ncbi:hypothetical protein [Sediminibacterium ginsengisoli]|uniref:Uncharacterized protein n=1 Tax=Sediminibacterium ginsengisoli TaxID=413434 RepID=A0A1T4R0M8_9BACT|nr:hypothetical protein [Sediminibacterium ginsengisoli]SKA09544.1 hypothetical protein SAMN04488132_11042 [Sediminibacterium ginsengisoli]
MEAQIQSTAQKKGGTTASATSIAGNTGISLPAVPVIQQKENSSLKHTPVTDPVIQGVFPDAYNAERRGNQNGIAEDDVQMDHIIPQDTLKKFADTYNIIKILKSGDSVWVDTVAALDAFATALQNVLPDDTDNLAGLSSALLKHAMVNMPANVVPGRGNQMQGAENRFDPQVEDNGNGVVTETPMSLLLRGAAESMKRLTGMITSSALPSGVAVSRERNYDADTDAFIAAELNTITAGLNSMNNVDDPEFDNNVWYMHGDKSVKKRSANWLDVQGGLQVGVRKPPQKPKTHLKFSMLAKTLKEGEAVSLLPVLVDIRVEIPAATWRHIYARHFMSTFEWDIQGVNTFWRTDPYTYLLNGGNNELKAELKKLLADSFNFSAPWDSVDEGEADDAAWSQSAQKMFFQGKADSYLKKKNDERMVYAVNIVLDSIAPEDATLGDALEPATLNQLKLAQEIA